MSKLPEWVVGMRNTSGDCATTDMAIKALEIAWEGLQKAKRWPDVQDLSAKAALMEACNDIQQTIRRIEALGRKDGKV